MNGIQVIAKSAPVEPLALSPDGTLLANFGTGFGPNPVFDEKTVYVREVSSSKQVAAIELPVTPIPNGPDDINQLRYCDKGNYLLAIGSDEKIYSVDTRTYQLHATFDLNPFEDPPPQQVLAERTRHHVNYMGRSGGLQSVACAANAPLAAFYIYYDSGLGTLKIFNLDTGARLTGFDDLPMQMSVNGIAVSPLGSRIGIFRDSNANAPPFPPGGYYTVIAIVDLKTKRFAKTINLVSDRQSGFFPIAFVGESTVAVQLFKREQDVPTPKDRFRYRFPASVHFYDIGSGSQVQVISDPDVEDFDFAGMSADGKPCLPTQEDRTPARIATMATGTGRDRRALHLGNSDTGKPIAQSPSLKVIHHTCPWYSIFDSGGGWGSCSSSDYIPSFAISQNRNAVVVTWPLGNEPVEVYTLPTH